MPPPRASKPLTQRGVWLSVCVCSPAPSDAAQLPAASGERASATTTTPEQQQPSSCCERAHPPSPAVSGAHANIAAFLLGNRRLRSTSGCGSCGSPSRTRSNASRSRCETISYPSAYTHPPPTHPALSPIARAACLATATASDPLRQQALCGSISIVSSPRAFVLCAVCCGG